RGALGRAMAQRARRPAGLMARLGLRGPRGPRGLLGLLGLLGMVGLLGLLTASIPPAAAASPEVLMPPPWRLALVVDCSTAMGEPWSATTRLLAAEAALAIELNTLPLRIQAGLWLAGGDAARTMLPPRPAAEIKGQGLVLPQLGGAADLSAAAAAAAAWLRETGPGSLVLVAGPTAGLDPAVLEGLGPDCFVHALCLGLAKAGDALESAAQAHGGGFFQAAKADQVSLLLHRAVMVAISRAQLLVLAHDPRNQPLSITYGLNRRDQLATRRRGVSGRACQLLPGVYQVAWPPGHDLGPGAPPANVNLAPEGLTRLWAGGAGDLALDSRGPDGRELNWLASVSNLDSGKVEASEKRTPFSLTLPAGFYRVKTTRPPLAWTVELAAGQSLGLVTGPPGKLSLALNGPAGPWRAPYRVYDLVGLREAGTGYTNSPLGLVPGRYRVEVQTAPPIRREVDLKPGQDLKLELPPVGALVVRRDSAGKSHSYLLLAPNGDPLMSGVGDRPLPVLPGDYRVQFAGAEPSAPVSVRAGATTALDPPQ
ncbi:MAG: hypothetical protein V1797_16470, partial [Pseudomonadota bacterium]